MKKQTLTLITLLLGLALNAYSQHKPTKFETELNDFRYSLYEKLDTLTFRISDIERAYRVIQPEIEEFINRHEQDIRQYRLNTLHIYKDMPVPDLDKYKPVVGKEELNEINSSFREIKTIKSIYDFNAINLKNTISMSISIFSARLGAEDMADENIKNSIAAYRIITRQRDKDNWQIYVDRYKYIYEFTYSFPDNFLYFENVYQRAAEGPTCQL